MDAKAIFNATVCTLGIAIFLIHSIDLLFKKGKRGDEKNLLVFFVFTALHFATYLSFVLIKINYTSNAFIMGFYTAFYIMNNLEALLLFGYARSYIQPKQKIARATKITNLTLIAIFIALDLSNLFGHFFFYAENGAYIRAPFMFISQGYQFIALAIVFLLAIADRKVGRSEKIAFSLYCALPLVATVVQILLPGYAVAYLSIIIAIEILFLLANVRKNAALAEEEKKNKEAEIRIMMSQIQPHFIYNALSSIGTLIKTDPDKAEKALEDFTDYLRTNLSALSDTRLVPFSDELRHIKTYLSLEKLRFDERLNVIYDIQESEFLVPALSVQPLVENAVKHGILQKIEGGTVTLRTYSDEKEVIVEIIDDGVGFDLSRLDPKDIAHVGLVNVRYRLHTMCRGEMKIESEVGKGAKVRLSFSKEGKA